MKLLDLSVTQTRMITFRNDLNNSRLLHVFDIQVQASPSKQRMSVHVRTESSLPSTALSCFSIYCATCIRAKALFVRYVEFVSSSYLYFSKNQLSCASRDFLVESKSICKYSSSLLFSQKLFLKMPC